MKDVEPSDFLQILVFGLCIGNRELLRATNAESFQDAALSRVIREMQDVDSGLLQKEMATRLPEILRKLGIHTENKKAAQAAIDALDATAKMEFARRKIAALHTGGKLMSRDDYIAAVKELAEKL